MTFSNAKTTVAVVASLLFLSLATSCTHRIIRSGYRATPHATGGCAEVITRTLPPVDSLTKVGEVELKDGGFSTACSEAHAIEILKKEACAVDAQIVHITRESRPDLRSTCYRCKASFYRYDSRRSLVFPDPAFDRPVVADRVSSDRKSVGAQVVGFSLGFVLSFSLVYMLMQ